MEYLRNEFDRDLNEEGSVVIAQNSFLRDQILRGLDYTAYEEAFVEWCGQQHSQKCERADEILSLFDNEGRFFKLKEIFARGAVTPFVGAGLSMPSGYPGWTKFLTNLVSETRIDKTEFAEMISNGQYEESAEMLVADLPEGSFLEQVENAFGISRQISGCIQKLPHLFKSAVITTNFDTLLERIYQDSEACDGFEEILLAGDAIDLPKTLGSGKRALVKLHGDASKSRYRVLTKSEYDRHYGTGGTLEAVIEAISNQTLLFMGCSLSVDRTLSNLTSIVRRKGIENIPKHYAFLKLDEPEKRLERRDQLAACNIHPIWYTDDHDECLEALLEKLGAGVRL